MVELLEEHEQRGQSVVLPSRRGLHLKPEAEVDEGPVVFYEGERIYFRPIEIEDERLLRRWINDPHNWRFLAQRPPLNAVREREYIESLGKIPADVCFGIVVKAGHRLIGACGLHGLNTTAHRGSLGIHIGERRYQSRGYGSEAVRLVLRYGFEELNLHRIELSVFSHNWRAISTYQRSGFVYEGCLREAHYVNGQYVDIYRFAILRNEWEEHRNDANA